MVQRTLRMLLPPCALLMLLFLTACGSAGSDKKEVKRPNAVSFVQGIIVSPRLLEQSVTVSGTLKAFDETVLMPEITGRVVSLDVPEGKFVKQGTLLVKLSDADLQAQLKKAQAQLSIAEQTEKRLSELLKMNGISQAEFDAATLSVNSVRADLDVLKAQIRKTEVLAPFDGTVGLRNVSVGAEVTPSTPLVTIRTPQRLKLDFSIPEKYGNLIKTGMAVQFTLQNEETPFQASVIATEQGIEASTRTLKVRALVKDPKAALVPGAFVTVTVFLSRNPGAILVPTQAVIPQERDKKVIVARQGKAVMVPVKTGVRQAALIEVISGLAPGDTVVTTGILFIKPGMTLTFSKITQ